MAKEFHLESAAAATANAAKHRGATKCGQHQCTESRYSCAALTTAAFSAAATTMAKRDAKAAQHFQKAAKLQRGSHWLPEPSNSHITQFNTECAQSRIARCRNGWLCSTALI